MGNPLLDAREDTSKVYLKTPITGYTRKHYDTNQSKKRYGPNRPAKQAMPTCLRVMMTRTMIMKNPTRRLNWLI